MLLKKRLPAIEVQYRSAVLLIVGCEGKPYVVMRPVIVSLGMSWRHHKNQLTSGSYATALRDLPIGEAQEKARKEKCLPLLQLHGWLLSLEPKNFSRHVQKVLGGYRDDCTDCLWSAWSASQNSNAAAVSCINANYQGRHFRFRRVGNEWWYAAGDVAAALGLGDTASLFRVVAVTNRVKLQIGRRHLHAINQSGLEQAYLNAPPRCTEELRIWLSMLQRTQPLDHLCASAAVRNDSAHLALNFLSRVRNSLKAAGAEMVEWDEEQAQLLADNVAALVVRNRRWLLAFDEAGQPQLSVVPMSAGVFTPRTLLGWIRDPDGASSPLIGEILQAVGHRIDPTRSEQYQAPGAE